MLKRILNKIGQVIGNVLLDQPQQKPKLGLSPKRLAWIKHEIRTKVDMSRVTDIRLMDDGVLLSFNNNIDLDSCIANEAVLKLIKENGDYTALVTHPELQDRRMVTGGNTLLYLILSNMM